MRGPPSTRARLGHDRLPGHAAGTLVLAVATFAAVRSANRSARISELTLQEQRRPVLVDSREQDIAQNVGFVDGRRLTVPGGGAGVEATGDGVHLAISLRNVGAGLAVPQGRWAARRIGSVVSARSAASGYGRATAAGGPPPSGATGTWRGPPGGDTAGARACRPRRAAVPWPR